MKRNLRYVFPVLGIAALLCFSSEAAEAVREGLRICGTSVIPALFPFFVLTNYFLGIRSAQQPSRMADRLVSACFGLRGSCMTPLLLSFLGGYPVGVSCTVRLYQDGVLSKGEAERLLLFCNNSGPAFFFGVIGGTVLHSVKAGALLYLAHILAALCCGALLRVTEKERFTIRRVNAAQIEQRGFLDAISASCASLLQISGLIVFFSVVLALFEASGLLRLMQRVLPFLPAQTLSAMLCGFFELSGGVVRLSACAHAEELAAFLMGWGGICVHLQAMSFWKPAHLQPRGYFASKLLHGLLSVLFVRLFLSPTPVLAICAGIVAAFCVFFPQIRQKWGRNLQRNTV
ncbi:MAG: sporulation protein [Faecousia sp.]